MLLLLLMVMMMMMMLVCYKVVDVVLNWRPGSNTDDLRWTCSVTTSGPSILSI